jgi:phosphoadenosine phosphosulfate reductase
MTAYAQAINVEMSDAKLRAISAVLEKTRPQVILRWALEEFGSGLALATGFGAEGCVLVSMLGSINPSARIFYLDTELLFPETYALRDQLEKRYGVHFERRSTAISLAEQEARYGARLWERQPDECCRLRKVEPLREMLKGLDAWITAIRREQSPTRAAAAIVERDEQFGLIKINPLAAWSSEDVWGYIKEHEVPYNALHDLEYKSIGCTPCTTPVQIGEDARAGRWRGLIKTECGIHRKRESVGGG